MQVSYPLVLLLLMRCVLSNSTFIFYQFRWEFADLNQNRQIHLLWIRLLIAKVLRTLEVCCWKRDSASVAELFSSCVAKAFWWLNWDICDWSCAMLSFCTLICAWFCAIVFSLSASRAFTSTTVATSFSTCREKQNTNIIFTAYNISALIITHLLTLLSQSSLIGAIRQLHIRV